MNDQNRPDFIFEEEMEHGNPTTKRHKTGFHLSDTKNLSRVLRSLGAVIIVFSASTFLFQHWTPGSDLQRYLLLLGFTSVLSLGGLFCGLRLKESKGARTLLGLTLAVTPINFAVMGALLFSQFSWDGSFANLPDYATWVASNPSMAVLSVVGGVIILGPLCHLSFLTLGHNRAKLLSTAFLLGNATLLLPTRQPNLIAGIFVLMIIVLTHNEIRFFTPETTLNTFEGRLSRGMLWAPAVILVGRASYFYTPSQLFISAIFTALGLFSYVFLPQLINNRTWQHALQAVGSLLASFAWLTLAELLHSAWSLGDQWIIPIASLPISGLLIILSRYAIGNSKKYHQAAAIVATLSGIVNLLVFPGLLGSFICLLIAIGTLCYGYLLEQKIIFLSGACGSILALGYHLKTAFSYYTLTGWSSLMVLGVLIIISASLLERNNGRLRERMQKIRTQLSQWEN